MNVVLVGCGAMSKAWLEATRQTAGIAIVGLVDLDADRARARAREFDLDERRDRDQPRRDARPDQARRGVRRGRACGAPRRGACRPLPINCHLLTEKPLADSWDNARAIVDAARRAGRIHAVVQNRRYLAQCQAHQALPRFRRDRRADQHPCRFLHRPAFRRLSRGDAPCPAARHGDPYVRRGPLHGERRAGERLLPGMGAAQFLVPAGIVGDRHLRARRRQGVHLPRQLVRRRLADQLGQRLADRRRARQPHLGRNRRIAGRTRRAGARGPARPGRTARRAAARSARPHRRPSRRDPGFRRAPSRTGTEPETRGTDNIKSLAMVFGAIESAETGRRVEIAAWEG